MKSDIQIELDWSALEINHCPKCNKELPNAIEGMVHCECDFKIRESRYAEILENLELEPLGVVLSSGEVL